jgi:hypothetical protein
MKKHLPAVSNDDTVVLKSEGLEVVEGSQNDYLCDLSND